MLQRKKRMRRIQAAARNQMKTMKKKLKALIPN